MAEDWIWIWALQFSSCGTLFRLLTIGSQPASLQNENDLYLLSHRDIAKINQIVHVKCRAQCFNEGELLEIVMTNVMKRMMRRKIRMRMKMRMMRRRGWLSKVMWPGKAKKWIKSPQAWDFPMVQWLRLHASNAGLWVQSLAGVAKKKKKKKRVLRNPGISSVS